MTVGGSVTSPAGDQPPAGVRAALEIVIGELATAYTASALASARSAAAASVIGAVVAAACSGTPTLLPAIDEATSVAPAPCWACISTSARVPTDTAASGTTSVVLDAIARGAPNDPPGTRVAARTVLFSAQAATAVPSDSSTIRGRSALPLATAGATRTGVHTPPAACAEAGAAMSRTTATRSLRIRIAAV